MEYADRVALMDRAATEAAHALTLEEGEFLPFSVAWPALRDGYLQWLQAHESTGARFESAEVNHELVLGDGPLAGPGAHGTGRAVLSALVLGGAVDPRVEVTPSMAAAVLELDGGACLVSATAPDLRDLSTWLPPF